MTGTSRKGKYMKKLFNKVWMLGFASLLGFTLSGCGLSSQLELKKETFVVEYGEAISTDAKDYLVKDTDKEILKEAKVIIKLNKKTPTDVGTYDASIKYDDETVKFKVKVKDTVKPEFVDFKEEIKIEQNAENVDYTKYFTAIDIIADLEEPAEIKVDSSKVDLATIGSYEVKVTATDANKNKTTKKATVTVVSAEEAQAGNVDATTEGNTPVSQVTQNQAVANNNASTSTGESTNTNTGSSGGSSGSSSGGNTGNTGGSTGGGNVCTGGTPNPAEIGNSGLLFYGNQAYYDWFDRMQANNGELLYATYGYQGFDAWTINFDACGNPMEAIVWTVNFK